MKQLPRGVVAMLILSALALVIILVSELLVPPSPREQLRSMSPRLQRLRAAADSCRAAVTAEQSRILSSDARFDSLRDRITYFEGLDPRGVPADSYDAYIEAFDQYNRGVPRRAAAGDSLEVHWDACRDIIEAHNVLADSVRALAEGEGLIRDTSTAPDTDGR